MVRKNPGCFNNFEVEFENISSCASRCGGISMSGSMHASVKHSFLRDIIKIMERSAAIVSTYVIDTRSSVTSFVTCHSLRSADLAVIKG